MLNITLCWHMHQPDYRDASTGQARQPWTYLHAMKGYSDMAWHLENCPQARAVVNFTPTLLEQIEDYQQQFSAFQQHGTAFHDPWLQALADGQLPKTATARHTWIQNCLRANRQRLVERYAPYAELATLADTLTTHPERLRYLNDDFLSDLLVWFHLAWMGEELQQNSKPLQALYRKGHGYSPADRQQLLHLIGQHLDRLIPRYRALADRDQVELCFTPYAHPIMPLLLDLNCAHDSDPHAPLPKAQTYPGGEARVRWHIEHGLHTFKRVFGRKPHGCWPSEGALSEATLRLLGDYAIEWVATGESVLHNSLRLTGDAAADRLGQAHYAYRMNDRQPVCFFRDDGLSDMIGFEFSQQPAEQAVATLIHHLENIARAHPESNTHTSIIMDGENAWEYFPENGHAFLQRLYQAISSHPELRLTTYQNVLHKGLQTRPLARLCAGSWVYGSLATWIGCPYKNLAWDMLIAAKKCCDARLPHCDAARRSAIEQQLAICEGSDWFWWFGDNNPADATRAFDELFRLQLTRLYELLGQPAPEALGQCFNPQPGTQDIAMGGVMKRGKAA